MTEKRFKFVCDDENCFFKDDNKVLDCYEVVYKLNKLHEEKEQLTKENNELKQLIDLFAQDICNLTEILSKNQLDYKLYSNVENFIIKRGVRIE